MTRLLLFCALLLPSPLLGAQCSSDQYLISGMVRDAKGTPIVGATVQVLLDVISEKKFHEYGVRARSFHTDDSGRYIADLDCTGEHLDRPSPCAKKPRDLTIAASAVGYRGRLRSFKLKKLPVDEVFDLCTVEVPDLALSIDR